MRTPVKRDQEAFWKIPDDVRRKMPDGVRVVEEKLGADVILLHITFPPGTDSERLANFGDALGSRMPKNSRAIFTEEGIKISVIRPRAISMQIHKNVITSDVLLKQIEALVRDQEIHQVNVSILDNRIVEPELMVQAMVHQMGKEELAKLVEKVAPKAEPAAKRQPAPKRGSQRMATAGRAAKKKATRKVSEKSPTRKKNDGNGKSGSANGGTTTGRGRKRSAKAGSSGTEGIGDLHAITEAARVSGVDAKAHHHS